MTPEQAARVLEKLARELQKRLSDVLELEDAYRGEFALKFASPDFRIFCRDRYAGFSDNWTQVVADAPHERLEITGIRLGGSERGDQGLWDTWLRNESDYFSDLAMLDAIIAKRSFALVWADADQKARITFESPGQAVVAYEPETRQRRFGAKVWVEDELEFATLYAPTEIWKFQRPRVTPGEDTLEVTAPVSYEGGWVAREIDGEPWPLENPLGVVPLVELPNKPRLVGEPISDISGTLAMQHAINLLWAQLFFASDAASFKARVILNAERPVTPILDADGNVVGEKMVDLKEFAANKVTWLTDPNAKIGEWGENDLSNWTKVIADAVGHIAAQTRTPAHYLMTDATFANVSADAMKALETGLVKRTQEKTQHFGRAVREIFRLVALVEGDAGKADAVALGTVLWRDVENRGDAQLVDALQKRRALGYPLRYILELDGLPDPEIDRVLDMLEEEQQDALLSNLLRPTTPAPNAAPNAQLGA